MNLNDLHYPFLSRGSIFILSTLYATAIRLSVCPFVRHTVISQKRLKLGSRNFHLSVAQSLYFWGHKFHPEILADPPPQRGRQTSVGWGKRAIFWLYSSISQNGTIYDQSYD